MRSAPPVHLTDKTRELLRLLAADPVISAALFTLSEECGTINAAMFKLSRMEDYEWDIMERKYRAAG